MRPATRPFAVLLLAALASGCVTDDEGLPRTDAAHGAALFARDCAACHGAGGRGGASAAGVAPDLTTLAARNGGAFPTIAVLAQIDGLGRHGDPEPMMPEFGAGDMGPTIVVELTEGIGTPVPSDLLALATYLEAIQE